MVAGFILGEKIKFYSYLLCLVGPIQRNRHMRPGWFLYSWWWWGAGCIDLTSQIDNFVALFDFIGRDLLVNVKY